MRKPGKNKNLFAVLILMLLATSAYAVSPKVVKTVPENGDENVRPGLRRIRIVFDQDMSHQGHSVCGGGPTFPEVVGKPRWTDKRIFIMSAKLKPSTEYELYVNSPSHKNFKNLQGEPAVVYHLKFKTAAAKGKARGAGKSPALLLQKARYAEETEGDLDRAIELYQQVIERADKIERIAARATYQLGMCHLKKGDKTAAAGYFRKVLKNFPGQASILQRAEKQLSQIEPEKVDSLFEQTSYQVLMFIAEKYGQLVAEAGTKSLFCNAHIYYVDSDLAVYSGGLGYHYNWTGHAQTGKVKLTGTSYPNQTLYDTNGQELNTEIVEDEKRKGFFHIYWMPEEPLKPQEALYYGWSKNDKRKLSPLPGSGKGIVTMQNQYGPKVLETFFLVLPEQLEVSDEATPTDSRDFGDYKVFWWTKEVSQNANHVENVMIQKKVKIENARRVVESFLSDVIAGNTSKAIKLVKPGSAVARQVAYMQELCQGRQIQITTVHANDRIALAFTNEFTGDDSEVAMLEITLIKQRGIWMIEDIDLENTAKAKADLSDFLKNNPDAGEVSTQISGKITDPKEVGKTVKNVILTISTCTESDPKVARSLKKLKTLDETAAVSAIAEYLDSDKPTVRRSAIFVLWRGEFDSIAPAEQKLLELCSHDENATRGMAAIALGAARVPASFATLTDMTLNDADGYARRCSAYALGLYGDKKALEVLNKALQDKDPMVKQNAQAAITMLTELKETQD